MTVPFVLQIQTSTFVSDFTPRQPGMIVKHFQILLEMHRSHTILRNITDFPFFQDLKVKLPAHPKNLRLAKKENRPISFRLPKQSQFQAYSQPRFLNRRSLSERSVHKARHDRIFNIYFLWLHDFIIIFKWTRATLIPRRLRNHFLVTTPTGTVVSRFVLCAKSSSPIETRLAKNNTTRFQKLVPIAHITTKVHRRVRESDETFRNFMILLYTNYVIFFSNDNSCKFYRVGISPVLPFSSKKCFCANCRETTQWSTVEPR